jgi:hypothetical protein
MRRSLACLCHRQLAAQQDPYKTWGIWPLLQLAVRIEQKNLFEGGEEDRVPWHAAPGRICCGVDTLLDWVSWGGTYDAVAC